MTLQLSTADPDMVMVTEDMVLRGFRYQSGTVVIRDTAEAIPLMSPAIPGMATRAFRRIRSILRGSGMILRTLIITVRL